MECKRCKKPLSQTEYICRNCGLMMSGEQIKKQKEQMKINKPLQTQLVSEKYGHKDFIFQKREKASPKLFGIFFLFGMVLLLFLIVLLVYL